MDMIHGIKSIESNENSCKGLIYKAYKYYSKVEDGLICFIKIKKIKKLSCSGCENCGWEDEYLHEVGEDWPIIGIEDVEEGSLYQLVVDEISYDHETGFCDDWCLTLIKYKG